MHKLALVGSALLGMASGSPAPPVQPNIVSVMIDDLGWSDVGFHGEASFHTPTMDALAAEGVVLDRFYTAPTCTPSRTQFMTGRYNIRFGMQDSVLHSTEPRGTPLTEKFLSTKLQEAGYKTVALGKWHLGMHQDQYLPQNRGFDFHYGIYTGGGSHTGHFSVSQSFTVRQQEDAIVWQGYNLWENGEISADNFGTEHSTHLYSLKAVDYIQKLEDEADDQPFFLYLAYQAVHDPIVVGNMAYIQQTSCGNITEPKGYHGDIDWSNRQILCGMVAEVDEGLHNMVTTLKQLGEWDNTFLVVFSDNGGVQQHGSRNLPLRGEKADYFEGGVRTPAFVSGGFVARSLANHQLAPFASSDLVHIADLHATFLALAQYAPSEEDEAKPLDGVSHLDSWLAGGDAARTELLVNINSALFAGSGALIVGDYKMMINAEPAESRIYAKTRNALAAKQGKLSSDEFSSVLRLVQQEVIGEPEHFLFNLAKNPNEADTGACPDTEACSNLWGNPDFADVQADLVKKWASFEREAVPSSFAWADDGPLANPELFGEMWAPWRDSEGSPKALYFGMQALDEEGSAQVVKTLGQYSQVDDTTSRLSAVMATAAGTTLPGLVALVSLLSAVGFVAYRAGSRQSYKEIGP